MILGKFVASLQPTMRKRKSGRICSRSYLLGLGSLRLFLGSISCLRHCLSLVPPTTPGTRHAALVWGQVLLGKRQGQPASCFRASSPTTTLIMTPRPYPAPQIHCLQLRKPRKTCNIHSLLLWHMFWAVPPPTNWLCVLSVLRFVNISGPLMPLSFRDLLWVYCF